MSTHRRSSGLAESQDRLIAAWGQMGSTWGISRTMAEVHALLYITGQALCTDDVMARLSISRGNASMSLRALVDWGVVQREHRRGDRKEYFVATSDVWVMLQSILRERMKREIHPVLANLCEIRDESGAIIEPRGRGAGAGPIDDEEAVEEHHRRLDDLIALVRVIDEMGTKLLALDPQLMKQTAMALAGGFGGGADDSPSRGAGRGS
ncbi:MAG: hypothetical protein IBJ18_02225 [Phycisphaerales bacterium]|nr:hypothetical protein [Phycisphaerales bacterium]